VAGTAAVRGSIRLRKLLVLIQFIITVSVIACTLLMVLQMRYVSQKPLGFTKDKKLIITLHGADMINKIPVIKKELLKNNRILGVTTSETMMGQYMTVSPDARIENNEGAYENMFHRYITVGEDYVEVMGMQLLKGRNFSKEIPTDHGSAFIANETMVKKLGWEEPLDKRIQLGPFNGRVIGVVEDFHFYSLHDPVEPIFLMQAVINTQRRYLILNITGEEISQTISFIEKKYVEFDPAHPFKYEFFDDYLNGLYLSDQRLMKLVGIFASVCIFISCLGLFGLAAFTTEQRTKEIGIRKVLGASTAQIIMMLSGNILFLVLSGALVGSLMAYYAALEWLAGFTYHIGVNPLIFLISAVIAAGVAFITVSLLSYKTAQENPVEALRYE
jgi:putative ABC transport system permease protein